MVDEREEWLARRFDVLEDVEVPDLWEQILVRADTEPNVDGSHHHPRRWVPIAAAAAVVALVGAGLILWTRDDPSQVDTPPGPANGDNIVQIVQADDDDDQAIVTTTAIAGIVSFDITNPTDGYRGVEIHPMLPGATIEDVRAAALEFARTGAVDTSEIMADPVLGVVGGPHDHFVTSMPLDAGEYAVLLSTNDAMLATAPDADGHEVRQLTVTTGDAGAAPPATLRFDRMADDYLVGDESTAPRGTATIRVDNTVGGPFQLAIKELRPDATRHDYSLWEQANAGVGRPDWSTAPVTAIRVFYAGAPQQTVTADLLGGDLQVDARPSFDQGGLFSFVWVTVE